MSGGMDVFNAALQKRKELESKREEAKSSWGSWGDYEQAEVVGLVDKKEIVIRILGNPIEVREKPTDPKFILQSQVVKDDKKSYSYINWPYVEDKGNFIPDPNWIVTKFMDKVLEGKWIRYEEKDVDGVDIVKRDGKIINTKTDSPYKEGYFNYFNSKTEIFKIITAGNSKEGEKFPKKFQPAKRVVANVIDRMDNWCVDSKHTKLLSGKKVPWEFKKDDGTKDTIYFTDTGIPIGLYDEIMDHCAAVGTLDIDLVIIKDNTLQSKYRVWDITDIKYLKDPMTLKIGKKDKLTPDELSYEMYDLDKLYKVSSYHKIKKTLNSRFALCDAELKTNFVAELDDLVKKEKEESEADAIYFHNENNKTVFKLSRKEHGNKENPGIEITKEEYTTLKQKYDSEKDGGNQESSKPFNTDDDSPFVDLSKDDYIGQSVQTSTIKTETPPVRRAVATPSVDVTNTPSIEILCKQNFDNWDKLNDQEKKDMIKAIDRFEGTIPIFKENIHPGCNNQQCYYKDTKVVTCIPETIMVCPICGTTFNG